MLQNYEEEDIEFIGTRVWCLDCQHTFRNIPNLQELQSHQINHVIVIQLNRNISNQEIRKLAGELSMHESCEIGANQFGECAANCKNVLESHYFQLQIKKEIEKDKLNNSMKSDKFCSNHYNSAYEKATAKNLSFILSLKNSLSNIQDSSLF